MKQIIFVVICSFLLQLTLSQFSADFSADFFLSRPGVLLGHETGKVYYSQTYKSIRYDYDPASSYYEIYHYDTSNVNDLFIYKACTGKCDITPQPTTVKQPDFNFVAGDSCASSASTTAHFGSCFLCTPAAGTVKNYCLKDLSGRIPIQVTLLDGTVLDLTNHVAGGTAAIKSNYDPIPAWGCKLNCGSVADIVLVIDESGSISSTEWTQLRAFAIKLVAGFTIAPDKINMGLVFFSTGARTQLPIISDSVAYNNAINAFTRVNSGNTWLGTGVINSANLLKASRSGVPKITILLTDGVENAPRPFDWVGKSWQNTPYNSLEWLTYHRGVPNSLICTIGVGTDSEIDPTYLTNIASNSPSTGSKMFFRASSFTTLTSDQLIKDITTSICTASAVPTPCPSCNGQCTCGTCSCPPNCDDSNPCTIDVCSATKNNRGGCLYEPKNCNDNNACTVDSCNPAIPGGCTTSPTDCDDHNVCTTDTCDPAVGCIHKPISCDDGDACTKDTCDPVAGCQHPAVVCDDGIPCTLDSCDKIAGCLAKLKDKNYCFNASSPCFVRDCNPSTGQCINKDDLCNNKNPCTFNNGTPNVFYPLDCQNGNKCRVADCDRTSTKTNGCLNTSVNCDDGTACTADTCNPATGCINTPVNCDDSDKCTIDTCDKLTGCVHTKVNCDDSNACTTDTCNPGTGCVYTPVKCDDSNNCTVDTCDFNTGCVNTPIDVNITCNDGNVCTTDSCDKILGCQNYVINCTLKGNYANNTTPCNYTARCDSVQGCIDVQTCNSTDDKTIPCDVESCDGNEQNCKKSRNQVDSCLIVAVTASVLTAGAIAGIIIAAVVCAGGAAAGAYAGYNFVFKGEFTNKNPLFTPETQTGSNPAYGRNSVFNQPPVKPTN